MEDKTDNVIVIEAYHGTAQAYKDSILRTKKMKKSSEDNEWAGTGIYYFVDEKEQELVKKCILWAKNVKRYKTAAIVKNTIEIESEKILDLTVRESQSKFQEYREYLYNKANEYAKKNHKRLEDKYTNFRKLDCLTINEICKTFKLELVKREAYVNFYRAEGNEEYPFSDISNVTMISLRNQDYIKEWSECNVK